MDKKPFQNVLKFIDNLWTDPSGYSYNEDHDTLEMLYQSYAHQNKFISIDDYLLEKTGIDNYKYYTTLYNQFADLEEPKRLLLTIALYNLIYFSSFDEQTKTKFSSFLQRYGIVLNSDNEYRDVIKLEENDMLEGSYGQVFLISDGYVEKKLKVNYWKDNDILSRFKNEYVIQRKLKKLNAKVLEVFDYDEIEHSFIMERADKDLVDFLEENILSHDSKLEIIKQLLNTIKIAHTNDIVHRDMHFGNLLMRDNELYLNDFGFAKDEKYLRSRLSTTSVKPNHICVAPEGLKDFKLLDKSSDIFSIGKIIDYIMGNGNLGEGHIFSTLVERCTRLKKEDRYNTVEEIIDSIDSINRLHNSAGINEKIMNDIMKDIYSEPVEEYILKLAHENSISTFMVSNKKDLSKLFLKISDPNKDKIITNILETYIDATGYNGWDNYDIFGYFSYTIVMNESDLLVRKKAFEILDYCASKRFSIKNLFDRVPPNIVNQLK